MTARHAMRGLIGLGAIALATAPFASAPLPLIGLPFSAPANGEASLDDLPAPPANGEMGFLVSEFIARVIQEPGACPQGTVLKVRDAYLAQQSPEERARLLLKENEPELTRRWQSDVFGPNGTNICSQPDMFSRPLIRTVQSRNAWGLNLDGDASGAASADTCAHDNFASPHGMAGVDNQEYRVTGCTLESRGVDGVKGDAAIGTRQFHASGEWTQVILLRGVDSLKNDPEVEVIYANTADRPMADSQGRFLPGASFVTSDTLPRHRNVLRGRIDNGVLTTEPQDILLTQTWGQGGARDIRGNRSTFDYRRGRLRLAFQSDGTIKGQLGGYRPVFDVIQSPSFGGAGSSLVAGIDCAAYLATLRKYADGIKDPVTGKCSGVSSAMQMSAIPAFVTDLPHPVPAKGNVK